MNVKLSKRWVGQSAVVVAAVFAGSALVFAMAGAGCGPNDAVIETCIQDAAPDGYDAASVDYDAGEIPFCQ